mmetsp:Transcript_34304/g.67453  ORF Transcript_34304/g.67453 Transcript_34304/m.67453 type:complete len:269 (+) Transcript_34304:261-1067(+)
MWACVFPRSGSARVWETIRRGRVRKEGGVRALRLVFYPRYEVASRVSCLALAGGCVLFQICGGGCDDDVCWDGPLPPSSDGPGMGASGGTLDASSDDSCCVVLVLVASPSPWYLTDQSSSSISMQAPFCDTHMTNLAIWLGVRISMTRPNSTSSSSPTAVSWSRSPSSTPTDRCRARSSSAATARLSRSAAACAGVTPRWRTSTSKRFRFAAASPSMGGAAAPVVCGSGALSATPSSARMATLVVTVGRSSRCTCRRWYCTALRRSRP